jgi:ribonuclease P protein component
MLRKTRKLNLAWPENHGFYRSFARKSSQFLSVYVRKNLSELIPSRATVVVGKKVSLLATQRNHVKRQLYQLLTEYKSWQLHQDLVIVVNRLSQLETYTTDLQRLLNAR